VRLILACWSGYRLSRTLCPWLSRWFHLSAVLHNLKLHGRKLPEIVDAAWERFLTPEGQAVHRQPHSFHCTGERSCTCPICLAAQRIPGRKAKRLPVSAPDPSPVTVEPHLACPTCATGHYSADQVAECADRYRQRTF
jgi:hypothetical protein